MQPHDPHPQAVFSIVTPSYAGDAQLCSDLHRSVLCHAPDSKHHIVVPRRDVSHFAHLSGPSCEIVVEDELLPPGLWPMPPALGRLTTRLGLPRIAALETRRSIVPVRNWILQQICKLALVAELSDDVCVVVDSDVVFVRDIRPAVFAEDGRVNFFRLGGGVHAGMPGHAEWHRVARAMLRLPAAELPLPDYVSSLNIWKVDVVRRLLARLRAVWGRDWSATVARSRHFSEWTLYGVFVDEVLGCADLAVTDNLRCHNYWETDPLDTGALESFLDRMDAEDVAVMISAKSHTRLDVRRRLLAETFI